MTQVKTCLCVPFLFGFPSFTIFLVKNKASASFSFGKWPAFFIGIDFCNWDNANSIQVMKPFLGLAGFAKVAHQGRNRLRNRIEAARAISALCFGRYNSEGQL